MKIDVYRKIRTMNSLHEMELAIDSLIIDNQPIKPLLRTFSNKTNLLYKYLSDFHRQMSVWNTIPEIVCRALLEDGLDPNGYPSNTTSLLFIACFNHHEKAAIALMEYGADVNFKDLCGYTPMIYAVIHKNLNLAKKLYSYGANPYVYTKSCMTPFVFACMQGDLDMIDFLYTHGGLGETLWSTVLTRAMIDRKTHVIQYLLQRIDPKELAPSYTFVTRMGFSGNVLDDALALTRSSFDESIHLLPRMEFPIWYNLTPHKTEMFHHVNEAKRTELACYLALYEQDKMRRFRSGEIVEFSNARLRQIVRPYGGRPIRIRIVYYLVSPHSLRTNYSLFWKKHYLSLTCKEPMTFETPSEKPSA